MQNPSRRKALAQLVGGAAVVAAGTGFAPASAHGRRAGWIDTHHHFLPAVYVDAVGRARLASTLPNGVVPDWTPESAIAVMEANGIAEGILSISSGPPLPDPVHTLRICNDLAADLRARYPGRFGSFASLPLPDVAASLLEIEHAANALKADGFIVFSNYGGKYLGDPSFDPVLAELNRRNAVVFIHPTAPAYQIQGQPNPALIEFPFDTTRCAFSLMVNGVLTRYPSIRFILSHGGGTLPYLSTRLSAIFANEPALNAIVPDPLGAIRSFYFDTAFSFGPASLAALLRIADPSRILLGTDTPMAPPTVVSESVAAIRSLGGRPSVAESIGRHNAARLLGRGPF